MPIDPSPLNAVELDLGEPGDPVDGLEEADLLKSRSNAGLVTSAPSCSRMSVIALPVCLCACWSASERRIPLAWIVTLLAPVFVSSADSLSAARTRSSRSLRSLSVPARFGKQRQDLAAELDQPCLGLVAGLGLGVAQPLDELEHPVANRGVRLRLGPSRPRPRHRHDQAALRAKGCPAPLESAARHAWSEFPFDTPGPFAGSSAHRTIVIANADQLSELR